MPRLGVSVEQGPELGGQRPNLRLDAIETPGIRGIYRYLVEQGHPITAHEEDFVEAMFARLAEGWDQSTGGHINLRAVEWIAAGAAHHALTLDEAFQPGTRSWTELAFGWEERNTEQAVDLLCEPQPQRPLPPHVSSAHRIGVDSRA